MKYKSQIAVIATLAIAYACGAGTAENIENDTPKTAKALFQTNCAICHGMDGRKGLSGAKIIPDSQLDLQARIALITNGKGNMMPYRDILTTEQIKEVAAYTLSLE